MVIIFAALFDTWHEGDSIPDGNIPRGGESSRIYKYQQRNAKLLWENRCLVHIDTAGANEDLPNLDDYAQSWNVRDYYINILQYLVALAILSARSLSRQDLTFAQQLLACCAQEFTRMNVHLSPSIHYTAK